MNFLLDFIKGVVIGMFMLVPGISGGSIAIILEIYDRLLISLNDLFKSFKKNFLFLLTVAIGGIIGIFISSFFLDFVIKNLYHEMIYIFFGMMLFYSFNSIKKTNKNNILKTLFFILVGLFIGFSFTKIPKGLFINNDSFLVMLLLGIFLAIALILPGISVSYVLLIFNIYNNLIEAIKIFDFIYLIKLSFYLIVGIFIVIKFLHYLLVKKSLFINNMIIGFIFSSIWIVLPKIRNFKELIYSIIFLLVGVIIKKILPNDN